MPGSRDFPSPELQQAIVRVEKANSGMQSAPKDGHAREKAVAELQKAISPATDLLLAQVRHAAGNPDDISDMGKRAEVLKANVGKFNKAAAEEESLLGKAWKNICKLAADICQAFASLFAALERKHEAEQKHAAVIVGPHPFDLEEQHAKQHLVALYNAHGKPIAQAQATYHPAHEDHDNSRSHHSQKQREGSSKSEAYLQAAKQHMQAAGQVAEEARGRHK